MTKKKEKTTLFSMRLNEDRKFWLDAIAKEKGLTLKDLFVKGALLYGQFDPAFFKTVDHIAREFNAKQNIVIQNIVLRYCAEMRALEKVYGEEALNVGVPEFQFSRKGFKTGQELLDELTEYYVMKFQKEKERQEKNPGKQTKTNDRASKKPVEQKAQTHLDS